MFALQSLIQIGSHGNKVDFGTLVTQYVDIEVASVAPLQFRLIGGLGPQCQETLNSIFIPRSGDLLLATCYMAKRPVAKYCAVISVSVFFVVLL